MENSRINRHGRSVRQLFLFVGLLLSLDGIVGAEGAKPFFFIQLSDPQFGMNARNADCQQETANFEFAIATANRLKPAFVIVTGDLVNQTGDKAQAGEYRRIAAKLDRSIVTVRDTDIEHRFYHLGEIPNQIDLSPSKKPAAKADRKTADGRR